MNIKATPSATSKPASNGSGKHYHVPAVARALDVLEYLARNQEASFTEIFSDLGTPKSSTYQLLNTLKDRGYIRIIGSSSKYALGLRLLELGSQAVAGLDVRTEAMPVLKELVKKVRHTINLGVLDGLEGVYLAKVEGGQPVRLNSFEGKRMPLHCTAIGKVLLAWLPEPELMRMVNSMEYPSLTASTITDPVKYLDNLAVVRQQGWALDDQENEPHIRCLAAPVRDINGKVLAAISISGLSSQFEGEFLIEMAQTIVEYADQISARLGCG
jgi:DNA-binding IclR family transcriptional regulator